jgi:glucokinase
VTDDPDDRDDPDDALATLHAPDIARSVTPEPVDAILAVDVGATQFRAALVSGRGTLLDRTATDIRFTDGPESHYTGLAGVVDEMLQAAAARGRVRVRGVGVACAGPVGRHLETASPVGLSWQQFPLKARLRELTGLPVFGDLDARALAFAEGWLGAAQGQANFCSITISATIGGGVVLDNELLDGESGAAGNIGHLIVEPGGRRCRCGAQGCLDAEASGLALEAITGRPSSEPTYEIMQRTGRLVGRAAASLCNALDLALVVVGGTVAVDFAATFFHAAQLSLDEHARLPYSRGARITPSRLGETGLLLGAGALGWRGVRRAAKARTGAPA